MVLARAVALSRATIGRHSILTRPRLTSNPRVWTRQYPPVSGQGLARRYYAESAPDKADSDREEQLLQALTIVAQSQHLAENGTPEQRPEALAEIEEANRIVNGTDPALRQMVMMKLMGELGPTGDNQPQSTTGDSVPAEVAPVLDEEGAEYQGQAAVEASQEEVRLEPDRSSSDTGADNGGHVAQDVSSLRAQTLAAQDAPSDAESYSRDQWTVRSSPAVESSPSVESSLKSKTSNASSLIRKYVSAPRPKPLMPGMPFAPTDPKIIQEPRDPDDKRKWEVLPLGHKDYPEMSKDYQERVVVIRRLEGRPIIRTLDKVWLRNACGCTACVDPETSWKNFNTFSVPDDLSIETMQFNKLDGGLEVQWKDDFLTKSSHTSIYPAETFEFFYRTRQAAAALITGHIRSLKEMLWNVEKLKKIRTIEYTDWKAKNSDYVSMAECLHVQGVALVKGTNNIPVEDVAGIMGPPKNTTWGQSWEVGHDPAPRYPGTTYTGLALSPESYAPWLIHGTKLVFLQCVENSVDGGEQLVVDGLKTATDMVEFDSAKAEILRNVHYRWGFKDAKGHAVHRVRKPCFGLSTFAPGHMILRLNQKSMTSDSPSEQSSSTIYRQSRVALQAWIKRNEDPTNALVLKMEPGDTLIYDAQRVLLGRKAFNVESGQRRFRATTLDMDGFAMALNGLDDRSGQNRGDHGTGVPYAAQVWKLAGLDPNSRPRDRPRGTDPQFKKVPC